MYAFFRGKYDKGISSSLKLMYIKSAFILDIFVCFTVHKGELAMYCTTGVLRHFQVTAE